MNRQQRCIAALVAGILSLAAGAAAQPAARNVPSSGSTANYVVGAGDRVRITVWNQADVSGEYTVAGDGSFTFPLIGRVMADGLTLGQLESELRRLLQDGYFRDPQVTASVAEYRSKRVFVMGALRTPGTYPLVAEMSVIEALALAGSPTADAADHAFIIHAGSASGPVLPDGADADEVTKIDLRRLSIGQRSSDLALRDGDTVYVPRAATVYVSGEVQRPGSYPIGQATTVRQVLALAGGATEYGATNRVRILRVVNGKEQELPVELDGAVQAGDTVVVPERFF